MANEKKTWPNDPKWGFEVTRTGGSKFDPDRRNLYFIAADRRDMGSLICAQDVNTHLLVAVNELNGANVEKVLEHWFEIGINVFIDSGIFFLTNEHARIHGVSMDEALTLAPEHIHGFSRLYDRYVELLLKYGDQTWGYIELDQGGRENKIKTREALEAIGLCPIPVYHPLNDGWDYFEYLAERYDRICFGNIVQADKEVRKRLLQTMFERKQDYPELWIHILGLTLSETMNAIPADSCDSSSWLAGGRWSKASFREKAAGASIGRMHPNMRYVMDRPGHDSKARMLAGYQAHMSCRNWSVYLETIEAQGVFTSRSFVGWTRDFEDYETEDSSDV